MRVRFTTSRLATGRLKRWARRSDSAFTCEETSEAQGIPPSMGSAIEVGAKAPSATNVPRPTVDATNPADSRSAYARTTVLRLVASSVASARVGGSR
jgi:hypothetical protein